MSRVVDGGFCSKELQGARKACCSPSLPIEPTTRPRITLMLDGLGFFSNQERRLGPGPRSAPHAAESDCPSLPCWIRWLLLRLTPGKSVLHSTTACLALQMLFGFGSARVECEREQQRRLRRGDQGNEGGRSTLKRPPLERGRLLREGPGSASCWPQNKGEQNAYQINSSEKRGWRCRQGRGQTW